MFVAFSKVRTLESSTFGGLIEKIEAAPAQEAFNVFECVVDATTGTKTWFMLKENGSFVEYSSLFEQTTQGGRVSL